jgi:hypothetical protein
MTTSYVVVDELIIPTTISIVRQGVRVAKKVYRITIRIDEATALTIQSLSELAGVSKSEVVRYAILFTRVMHDPSLRLRDVLKNHMCELLVNHPEVVLDMPFIDLIKPLRQLVQILKPPDIEH